MYCTLKIFIVCFMLSSLAQAIPKLPGQQNLARLFFSSRLAVQDPERTMRCFENYVATSSVVSGKYSKDYNSCLQRSKDTRRSVDTEVSAERQSVLRNANAVCDRIKQCNILEDNLDYFSCHADSGSPNTKATYAISTNSSDFVTILQERHRTIQLNEEKCCSSSERSYVKETTRNYDQLQNCLSGEVPLPIKPTTGPTTTSTTEKPTEEPKQPEGEVVNTEDPIELQKLLSLVN